MDMYCNWLVKSAPDAENGLFINTDGEFLTITDLSSSVQKSISRNDFVKDFKYRREILNFLQNSIGIFESPNRFIDNSAAILIDKICESNRLLY